MWRNENILEENMNTLLFKAPTHVISIACIHSFEPQFLRVGFWTLPWIIICRTEWTAWVFYLHCQQSKCFLQHQRCINFPAAMINLIFCLHGTQRLIFMFVYALTKTLCEKLIAFAGLIKSLWNVNTCRAISLEIILWGKSMMRIL